MITFCEIIHCAMQCSPVSKFLYKTIAIIKWPVTSSNVQSFRIHVVHNVYTGDCVGNYYKSCDVR